MTRSITCHDNPLFLSDNNNPFKRNNTTEAEDTPDLENNHSTNSLNSNSKNHRSMIIEPEERFDTKENEEVENENTNDNDLQCNDESVLSPPNEDIKKQRCTLCILSHQNENNVDGHHR